MHSLNNSGIRWLRRSQWATQKFSRWIEAIQSGIFMGLVDDEAFQGFDTHPFDETEPLDVSAEIELGLERWERQIVLEHLADAKSILVIAAGGARELVGLHELGYDTTGIEYGRPLCEASRRELARRECSATIQWCERFDVPRGDELYDAAFVARKFLSHVHDRRRRIELLRKVRQTLCANATLVVACYTRERGTLAFRMQAALANFLRKLRGQRDFPVEVGDHLAPESPLYHHHYARNELRDELRAAGFATIEEDTTWFGWAVARTIPPAELETNESAGELTEIC